MQCLYLNSTYLGLHEIALFSGFVVVEGRNKNGQHCEFDTSVMHNCLKRPCSRLADHASNVIKGYGA